MIPRYLCSPVGDPRYLCSPVHMIPGTNMFPGTDVPRFFSFNRDTPLANLFPKYDSMLGLCLWFSFVFLLGLGYG